MNYIYGTITAVFLSPCFYIQASHNMVLLCVKAERLVSEILKIPMKRSCRIDVCHKLAERVN